ncbi:MAG: outer membrane beta-barrel protein [Aliifodinibius sp.]|nr:outer membrane beta-barrel protein [Fodinibius sp.]
MYNRKVWILFISCIFLGTAQLNAQGINLGPQLGYQKAADADGGKFMGGAAMRLKLSSSLGVEGSINYRQEDYANGNLTVKSWPVMVTGLIYPLPIVYGAVGAGWYNTTFDFNQENLSMAFEDETKQEFGWHFGAGVELTAGSNLKLTGDIRYVFLNYDFEQIPGTGELNSDFYVITAGLLFGL